MTRIAVIEQDKCNSLGCGEFCIKKCPVNKMGKECIVLNEKKKAVISEQFCNGCNICTKCPYGAIHIINLPEKLKEDPIIRFRQNSFELFSLPLVKKDSIVGIIGRNGIGKTTSLQILSGTLKANLGKYDNPPENEEIVNKYSTKWMGEYFTKLFDHKIKVAYKPQRVELLAEMFEGVRVKDLLIKADERGIYKHLVSELDMDNILDRNVEELSGGELQRVAIIATLCKNSEVIYFDEPSSFLDIMHRIKVAKLIREYSKGIATIVVEHDLATLDYISDEIQIIYGEPACYGIVSNSKSVRRGINEYLDGYLADDNIRFRNYSIKFNESSAERYIHQEILLEYPELEKKFEKFHLKIGGGSVHKGEVLTIMGGNGLGKTTFLKILAGELISDRGKIHDLKISYKPQYLNNKIEGTVESYLRSIGGDDFESGWYRQNILEKLGLKNILNNEIKYLSGGELQKVHIAACLSDASANVIAMDEPSAFVDVEDRLKVAEIIKEFVMKREVCAIIVDHDIQFVDYLGDSMLVFEGEAGVDGHVIGPLNKIEGMNRILKNLDITYRKDKITFRPRINKEDSQLDVEQKSKGNYYYIGN